MGLAMEIMKLPIGSIGWDALGVWISLVLGKEFISEGDGISRMTVYQLLSVERFVK